MKIPAPAFFGLLICCGFVFKIFEDKPACAIALIRQNIFYIGVESPVRIVVRGVPVDQVVITSSPNLTIVKKGNDQYVVNAKEAGAASITVTGGNMEPVTFPYRVKHIPDPVPLLGAKYSSCSMKNGEFKAQSGIAMVFAENFDFDVHCDVTGYEVTYFSKKHDPVVATNSGGRFSAQVRTLIDRAKPGDIYFFDNIKFKCPGDGEYINLSLVFHID